MAAGTYLSSKAAYEAKESLIDRPISAGAVMLVSYIFGGIFPLIPYFFLPVHYAYAPSIALTVMVLFATGVWKARVTKKPIWKSAIEMVIVSGIAASLGYLIGNLLSGVTGI